MTAAVNLMFQSYLRCDDECVIPNPDGLVRGNLLLEFTAPPVGEIVVKSAWMESFEGNVFFDIPVSFFDADTLEAIRAEIEDALS